MPTTSHDIPLRGCKKLPHFCFLAKCFLTDMFKALLKGEDSAKDFVQNYIQDVKQFVPKDRLLIINRNDIGWDHICGFLNLPVPNEPFPHDMTKHHLTKLKTYSKLIRNILLFGLLFAIGLSLIATASTYLYIIG